MESINYAAADARHSFVLLTDGAPAVPDDLSDQDLFDRLVDAARPERAALLNRHCADAPDRRALLERLLEAHDRADSEGFLEDSPIEDPPIPDMSVSRLIRGSHASAITADATPTIITSPTRHPDPPPIDVPGHTLVRFLGSGASGTVWLAKRDLTEHLCAVKIFEHAPAGELDGIRVYKQAATDHPGLLPIEEVGSVGGYIYCSMARADNAATGDAAFDVLRYEPLTLRRELQRAGRLPASHVAGLGAHLAAAIDPRLHQHDLVHQDVKPDNILSVNGQWKLADFGTLSQRGAARGYTPGYRPPNDFGTPHHDRYALGVTLYELVTGLHARDFDADQVPSLIDQAEGADADLLRVVERLTRQPAAGGYASTADAIDDLERIAHPPTRSNRTMILTLVSAVALALVLSIMASMRGFQGDSVDGQDLNAAAPVRDVIRTLAIDLYREDPTSPTGALVYAGSLSPESPIPQTIREGDSLRLSVEFDRPVYAFLVALQASGGVALCAPDDPAIPPEPATSIAFPPDPTNFWVLTEGVGLHGFAVITSTQPLPSYRTWLANIGSLEWPDATAEGLTRDGSPVGAYAFDGVKLLPLATTRGVERRRLAPRPVENLAARLTELPEGQQAEAIIVPVLPSRPAPAP